MDLFSFDPAFALSGLATGFLVGLTGVGGGSLMTPLLVLLFGIAPSTAVGTDLLYASITKVTGIPVHARKGHIDWRVAGWLTLGSAPAALAMVVLLSHLHTGKAFESILKTSVGVALVITAAAILWRASRQGILSFTGGPEPEPALAPAALLPGASGSTYPVWMTVLTGAVLGALVTMSSIGAGAIGTVALVFLYPRFRITRIVGTDIAHAVPLTLIAGLGHLGLGHVNGPLLVNLLIGSIPGIWLGSHASAGIPERWSRPILAVLLLTISARMIAH
ncbi:MAG: sulfite exporter TauE/SafE family protein [Pseudomonadota bacterium]|nr:sulfite exporter TauE/SafE family protein [Pseudomonadota bacterium]